MATICKKCGGIIPDICIQDLGHEGDCKYHRKSEIIERNIYCQKASR